jgi:hypothetical protein
VQAEGTADRHFRASCCVLKTEFFRNSSFTTKRSTFAGSYKATLPLRATQAGSAALGARDRLARLANRRMF